ncbi:aspartate aminotransferase family protein [Leucobacter japonicus]|uniref:aspartate aminotransferase family protein n=1 Tax=Leucobacter japonicus TaxID=1461259 RepID=UPI00138F5D62|nr:aminotransferase class III-fold pyridoxal phosphate-dependent enzyme [Leucobacter japonicus]
MFTRGEGAYIWDVDGNKYIDAVCAHGPVFLGHANPVVNAAAIASLHQASQFGGSIQAETELAELALSRLPFAQKLTLMTTGTEAVQLALRIAQTATGRDCIVKFDGHYHGWIDPVYVNIPGYDPQPPADLGIPGQYSPVDPDPAVNGATPPGNVVIARWNDLEHFRKLMADVGSTVAGIIMEPLLTGFGTFKPQQEFIEGMIDIAHEHGALVIFDEIVSGFRVAPGGAAELLGVSPDIAIYAKAVANGFPIAMVAGSEAAMACVTDGTVPAAGTYSGTPHCVEAAKATLGAIFEEGDAFYDHLEMIGARLKEGFERVGEELGLPISANQLGPLVQLFCGEGLDTESLSGVYASDRKMITAIMEEMIARGVYTTRKGLFFLNRAHTAQDIDDIARVFREAARAVSGR